jgi:hypothetical protein
MKVSKIEKWLG